MAGVAHVLVSIVLGGVIVAVGLQFRSTVQSSLVIFAVVTIGTIVGLTLLACFGGYQIRGRWLERWGNVFTALVLIAIGALVLTGAI